MRYLAPWILIMGIGGPLTGCVGSAVVGEDGPTPTNDAATVHTDRPGDNLNPMGDASVNADAVSVDNPPAADLTVPAETGTTVSFPFRSNLCTTVRGEMSPGQWVTARIGCENQADGSVLAGLGSFRGFLGDSRCVNNLCRQQEVGEDGMYHMLEIHRDVSMVNGATVVSIYAIHLISSVPNCPPEMANAMKQGGVRRIDMPND